jgi:pimeloyl-ACP methyl ester carboxylesterase
VGLCRPARLWTLKGAAFTVEEAATDVLEVADALGWRRFAIIGHSMSSLVALHLVQHWPGRIEKAVLVTPPPPMGLGADESRLDYLRSIACGDDSKRIDWLRSSAAPSS